MTRSSDNPVLGEEIDGMMGDPPTVSEEEEVMKLLRDHAVSNPAAIRAYIVERAKELAIGASCRHTVTLATFREDSDAAQTCGQHQASILGRVNMQVKNQQCARTAR